MKVYEQGNTEDIGDFLTETVEKETGKKIFTMRVLDKNEEDLGLETLVIFEDKSVLMAMISVQNFNGQLAARIQGNYI